jgi:hypothetical protein
MYCGSSISVKEATAMIGLPDPHNILKVAIGFIESGNFREADIQTTKVLEHNPENSKAWLCKAAANCFPVFEVSALGPTFFQQVEPVVKQVRSWADQALTLGIDDIDFKSRAAEWFLKSAKHHLGERSRGFVSNNETVARWTCFSLSAEIAGLRACSILYLVLTCLKIAFALKPSREVAAVFSNAKLLFQTLSRPHRDWQSYGQPLMVQLEEAIINHNPEWLTAATAASERRGPTGCYVATSTLGDYDHPDVILLRTFRDKLLSQFPLGRLFIRQYYRFGPDLAKAIEGSAFLRWLSYRVVVRPAAVSARFLMRKTR